jgi:NADPH:quinone reductase-like Zn-dependent oxidoreductase/acyl carrier protein
LLGQRIASPQRDVLFDGPFALAACPPLLEHRIGGVPIVPAAAYIEAANAAAVVLGSGAHVIANGWLRAPLLLDPATPRRTQLVVARSADGAATFEVFSRAADDESAPWTSHAGGRFASAALAVDRPDLAVVRERCKRGVDVVAYRREMTDVGLDYGPSFHSLVAAWGGRREAFGELRLPHDDGIAARVMAHPGMLDAAFHLIGVAFEKQDDEQRFFLPTGYEAAELSRRLGTAAFAYVALRDSDAARLVADIWLWQADGTPAGCVLGLAARATSKEQFTSAMARRSGALHLAWPAARDAAQVPAGGVWRVLGGSVELRAAVDQELRARGAHVELCDGAAGVLRAPKAGATALGVVDLRPSTRAQSGAQLPTQTVADGPVAATTELLRTAAGGEAPPGSRLLVVTRATQRVSADETVDACGATLWGIVATAAAEIQGVDVRLLDLEADGASADDAAAIAAAALRADDETRLARRGREFHAPRLTPAGAPDSLEVPARAYTLAMRNRGSLDGLAIEPLERVTPGPRQVEIEVLASGLNFRDVLNLLDMYPGPAGPLGNECCGRIVAVGSEVTELAVGDLVMCIAESTFGSHVIAEATLTFRVPAKLSLAQAAAFPIAQLTAYLALYRVGGIRRGDRVLIHAGAGGVGLAAVHLALAAGAEVLASAGSEEKRDYLRRLGVRHVFDSRRVPDAAAVRAATEGHGVDLLLNSLTGEFIDAGIDALATGGRFLEIGLRELRTPEQVRARRDDIAYHALLLGDWCRNDPAAVRAMYDALVAALDAGRIPPPAVRAFPLADAPRAFRFMAQARHIGRIALTHRAVGTAGVRADARYVITGGLGAIGLHVARWLVERGARYVVLAARSAPNDAAARAVAELRARGATIELVRGDVADPAAVSLGTQGAPVRGIFHAAGVVDDVILARLDTARLLRVLRPKADGLHNLLRATTDDLDMLVLFSSGSAVLGSPGQAAYAGANAFLDGSAHALRAAGRVATSVNWGAWAESGMAARVDERTAREWQARGIGMLTPDAGLRELEAAIGSGAAQTVALAIDWPKFLGALERRPTLLEELGPQRSPEPSAAAGPSLRIVLEQLSPKQRLEHLTRCMVDETAAVLGVGADDIVVRSGLTEQGMDSLMAVELANRLGRLAGVSLPSTFAFDHPTLAALAEHLLAQVLPPEAGSTGAARSSPKSVATGGDLSTGDLGALSATELEEELRRELDRAGF